jgi:phosphate starvation-inducible protein PhoH
MKKKHRSEALSNINKNELYIKEKFEYTQTQKDIINCGLDSKNCRAILINGRAGVSKTYLAILIALKLLKENKIPQITYIRSLIQSQDGETGFLAGSLDEKTMYFNVPLYDKLTELISKPDIERLFKEGKIQTLPTSMLRGNQLSGVVIVDESQNLLESSLTTVLTRMAEHSLVFLLGDTTSQNDLGSRTGFKKICEIFNDSEAKEHGIHYFELDSSHIVRSTFVKFIVQRLEKLLTKPAK